MIQDIYPHKLYNQYDPDKRPGPESIVLSCRNGGVLMNGVLFPMVKDLPHVRPEQLTYLFSIDHEYDYFLLQEDTTLPEGFEYINIRDLRSSAFPKKYRVFVAYTGLQLANWYRNNRFCGRCGSETVHDERERAIRCPGCGHIIYPRVVPAVIVGVKNGDRLLVTKYRTGFGHFALVAGFTEIGETLEETAAREVMEEAGLRVKNIRYYKSQPWGIVDDLLAGFYCDVDGDDTITMDPSELKVAEWRTREEIELQPDDYSLTNEMMRRFKEGLEC